VITEGKHGEATDVPRAAFQTDVIGQSSSGKWGHRNRRKPVHAIDAPFHVARPCQPAAIDRDRNKRPRVSEVGEVPFEEPECASDRPRLWATL